MIVGAAEKNRKSRAIICGGYLLDEDLPEILRHAEQHWDYLVSPAKGQTGTSAEEAVCTISRMGKECGF